MTRPYVMRRRAERQAETRQRIVEAAVELHGTIGPGLTSLSMVAERAGVQRHTLYAHFPEERSLYLACSGHSIERDPLPEPLPWRSVAAGRDRLREGLGAIYAWYGRNEQLAACVVRDAEFHALTREMFALRIEPAMRACAGVLGEGLDVTQRAVLGVMLGFHAWRGLVRGSGLAPVPAVAAAVRAIAGPA